MILRLSKTLLHSGASAPGSGMFLNQLGKGASLVGLGRT